MAMPADQLFSTENAVFKSYLFYSSLLVLKMMLMSMLTGRQRFQNKVSFHLNYFLQII